MTAWLLDTNVLSELRRPRPEPKVVAFVRDQPLDSLHISTVTLAEIRFGIERLGESEQRTALHHWLDARIRPMFEGRTLAITEDVMLRWRLLFEEGRKARHTFTQPDLIIAATAIQHDLTVVTRDVNDYRRAQVAVMNPWLATHSP
ncbi:MAG: type II toxin-antitoxin system VapC family toxin [Methylorubrum rhodinum]|uniref:type II toxin-antitoxin system VapC family toxin n=1 Tax=Methylorubrum rhodinum TaxID=29428 RepID=UPI003BB0E759